MVDGDAKDWAIFEAPPEVIPRNDLLDHPRGLACPCNPRIDGTVIVHNSFDMREENE